jgi:hypothetical protein
MNNAAMRLAALLVVVLWALQGCAASRASVGPESSLQQQLGFVRSADVTRADIETRLGEPMAVYESGRIVSYALYWLNDRFNLSDLPGSECYGLVIAYADDGHVAKHGLVRMGSYRCRR